MPSSTVARAIWCVRAQLGLVAAGKDVELNNEPEPESEGESEPEEDTGADKKALAGLMGADY